MRRPIATLALAALTVGTLVALASPAAAIGERRIVGGLDQPVAFTFDGDGKVTTDAMLRFADADAAKGKAPRVVAGAYINSVKGAKETALFDIDATLISTSGAGVRAAPPETNSSASIEPRPRTSPIAGHRSCQPSIRDRIVSPSCADRSTRPSPKRRAGCPPPDRTVPPRRIPTPQAITATNHLPWAQRTVDARSRTAARRLWSTLRRVAHRPPESPHREGS